MRIFKVLEIGLYAMTASLVAYCAFVSLLTIPAVQSQVVYLNRVTLTWGQDVNYPEQWGFLHNQVTPFKLQTSDGESLHAWHILPLEVYRRNQERLMAETDGLAHDVQTRLGFQLLRDDPEALLVLYFHGAAGTLGSGWRPPSYRAMSAGAPDKIHTLAIDYRGFGDSTGNPSEHGLLTDAITLVEWAMDVAGIPPSRIVLYAQSLGTGVTISLMEYMATRSDPVLFAGSVLTAPFVDVALLTATYQVAGTIPLLGPVARFPKLLEYLNTFSEAKWPNQNKLASFIRHCEGLPGETGKYHITLIHGQNDYDIPWQHTEQLFWHAVNATLPLGMSYDELEHEKDKKRRMLGSGGWDVTWQTQKGQIAEKILITGLHDVIMSYPTVSLAVLDAFHAK